LAYLNSHSTFAFCTFETSDHDINFLWKLLECFPGGEIEKRAAPGSQASAHGWDIF